MSIVCVVAFVVFILRLVDYLAKNKSPHYGKELIYKDIVEFHMSPKQYGMIHGNGKSKRMSS